VSPWWLNDGCGALRRHVVRGPSALYLQRGGRTPAGIYLITWKALAVAYVPFIAVVAIGLATVGAVYGSWWIAVPAGLAAAGAIAVVVRVGSVRVDLTGVLGVDWDDSIPSRLRRQMVGRWWTGPIAKCPEPRLRQDIRFRHRPGHRPCPAVRRPRQSTRL
jgi:hypothetical protein